MTNRKPLDRIPQHIIDDLVSQTDILATIEHDVLLKKAGRDYVGLCPFHKESSPSFSVSPEKQFYYCFGCGASGNSMDFMVDFHKMSFLAVLQDMADKARTDLDPYLRSAQNDAKVGFNVLPALDKARAFFKVSLKDGNPGSKASRAREYLISRQVSDELSELFSIGFAGYGKLIVEGLKAFHEPLIEAGVLDSGDHGIYSLFRDRVMLPVRDVRGKTVALSGRALSDEDMPKYKNSKETPHFNKTNVIYGLYESLQAFGPNQLERLIIVEGQFDAIANHIIEVPAGAVMGSSLSIQQLRLIKRHTSHATFVFDPDKAGNKAMMQTCSLLLETLTDAEVLYDMVMLPEGEDPHSMITTQPEAYKAALSNAIPWLDLLIDNLPGVDSLDTQAGQIEYATAAVKLISTARDPLLRHQALEKVAEKSSFPVAALNEKLMGLPAARSGHAKTKETPVQSMSAAAIRLTRILWDEPLWSNAIADPQLWAGQGDELISLIGLWSEGFRNGEYDAPASPEEIQLLAKDAGSDSIVKARRARGGAIALGRMLSMLPSHYMEQLMRGEPETKESIAISLSWHITSICAKKEMQALTKKAGLGIITADELERFKGLVVTLQIAAKRSRSIED